MEMQVDLLHHLVGTSANSNTLNGNGFHTMLFNRKFGGRQDTSER